jgi:hypothetical protein
MTNLLTIVENAHALWEYLLSLRFFWPAILCVVGVLYEVLDIGKFFTEPLYSAMVPASIILAALVLLASATVRLPHEKRWLMRAEKLLDACDFDQAAQLLTAPPPLLGFAARAARQAMLIRLKIETGDLRAAYQTLIAAEKTVLLPNERLRILLSKAQLLFNAGNYAAFGQLLAATPGERIRGYNHLNAQSYYEQAWAQLQATPVPALYPVVLHNLLISYGMQHAPTKALRLLATYRQAVKPDNVEQVQALLSQHQAQAALQDADQIAQATWPHASMTQYAFGLAYFYWQVANRADLATTWLTRFNQSGQRLAHSAAWLRKQHAQLTAWLENNLKNGATQPHAVGLAN